MKNINKYLNILKLITKIEEAKKNIEIAFILSVTE